MAEGIEQLVRHGYEGLWNEGDLEALLAIANIESMLAPGGYFIHNELRAAIDQHTAAVGLTPVQARTVRIGSGTKAPLYDAFAIYEKPAIRK